MKIRYYCFAAIGKGLPAFMEYPSLGKAKTEYVNLVHGRQDVYLSPYIIGLASRKRDTPYSWTAYKPRDRHFAQTVTIKNYEKIMP